MASLFRAAFPTPNISYQNPDTHIITEIPAKDPSRIEIMDSIGICLSALKSLSQTITELQTTTQSLINRVDAL
jgi:hypothetical protein